MGLELSGCEVVQGGVFALSVVVAFDVVEDFQAAVSGIFEANLATARPAARFVFKNVGGTSVRFAVRA